MQRFIKHIKDIYDNNFQYVKGSSLGSGANGAVYNVTIENLPDSLKEREFVAKEVHKQIFHKAEPKIQSRYHPTSYPLKKPALISAFDSVLWFTEKVKGESFSVANANNIEHLTLLDLINQLAVRLNLHHHNTPTSGSAIIHGDLHGGNILFYSQKQPNNKITSNIDLIDYGSALEVEDNPNRMDAIFRTTNQYFPLTEKYQGTMGIKTDIYMVSQHLRRILIVDSLPDTVPNIKPIIKDFMNRCNAIKYELRPDSDQFLKFYTVLNLFYREHALNDETRSEKKYQYAAMMVMLSHNLFNSESRPDWNNYDYENLAINKVILNFYKLGLNIPERKVFDAFYEDMIAKTITKESQLTDQLIEYYFACHILVNPQDFSSADLYSALAIFINAEKSKPQCDFPKPIDLKALAIIAETEKESFPLILQALTYNLNIAKYNKRSIVDFLGEIKKEMRFINYPKELTFEKVIEIAIGIYGISNNELYQLIGKKVKVADFKQAYLANYKDRFFANPLSKMKLKLEKQANLSMGDIIDYAQQNESSETRKVLIKLL